MVRVEMPKVGSDDLGDGLLESLGVAGGDDVD